jgi:hypothetical protein
VDLVRLRQRLLRVLDVLLLGDVPLLGHLREDEVAPFDRHRRVGGRVIGRGAGDDPGEHRRFPRQEVGGAAVIGRTAAGVVVAEVGLCSLLDPVSALTEVDLVQVRGEDLVLVPLALELVGQRRLAELLEDGSAALGGQRVLHELLGDSGGSLRGAGTRDVLHDRAADPHEVDAAVLVEALVLDRDGGLLHDRGDVLGADQDAAAVVREGGELLAVDVVDDGVLRVRELRPVLELGKVARDGHHDPEDPRDEGKEREPHEDEGHAELPQLRATAGRWGARRPGRQIDGARRPAAVGAVAVRARGPLHGRGSGGPVGAAAVAGPAGASAARPGGRLARSERWQPKLGSHVVSVAS